MKRHSSNTLNSSSETFIPKYTSSIEQIQSPECLTQTRHQAIEEAAYLRASERGFASGGELDDWLAGEAEFEGGRIGNLIV
jgi:hypothetical protein